MNRTPAELGGLPQSVAEQRLAEEGPNLLPGAAPRATLAIVLEVVSEPMFLMLLAAGGIYLALGDRAEAVFLLVFVFAVIGITLAQERRTQRALESLRDLSAPRALVMRDGAQRRIAGRDVVREDLIVLCEGDRVPADAVLVDGRVSIDESLLSGESVPVGKHPAGPGPLPAMGAPGGEATPFVFAGTVVTGGVGMARVRATAGATAVGRIGAALAHVTEPPSSLQQRSRALVRTLGIAAAVLAAFQVLLAWLWDGRPLLDSLLSGIALAMAILPEEIPVIITVFLALGAWRIARQQVLTRRVSAVEALGAITVLAVDKTGTLTQNRMAVVELVAGAEHFAATSGDVPEAFHELMEFAMLATPADPFDPMEKAIQAFGHERLSGTEHVHEGRQAEREYPLSAEILAMTRVFAAAQDSQHLLATKGAPEAVCDLCHLAPDARDAIRRQVEELAGRGLRVLGVAKGRWQGDDAAPARASPWPPHQHVFDFTFLGLVALADPPRPDVAAAIAQCRDAGVRVIMMTGDHPATALAIARAVGLSDRPQAVTGPQIDALDDDALRARLKTADVCARLQPGHKMRLVQVLRAGGDVVAMTGDGVNDAPALKAADVGIAMGQRGTDVAREAASLVLLDDGFTHIVAALAQGRRIFDNIGKASCFAFAVHVPIIGLALVPALLQWPVLLLPVQIVLLELLIDPACSIVFEAEPADADLMSRPPRALGASPFSRRIILAGVLQGAGTAAILLGGFHLLDRWGLALGDDRGIVFTALVLAVLLLTLANRNAARPLWSGLGAGNPWIGRMAAAVGLAVLGANLVPALRRILGMGSPDAGGALAALALAACCVAWLEALRRFRPRRRAP